MAKITLPAYVAMMNPLIEAVKELGGSGTIEEIENKVAEILSLTDEQLDILHGPDKSGQSEFSYRLAWTRTYLKRFEIIENSSRGVWALTAKGGKVGRVDEKEVVKVFREHSKSREADKDEEDTPEEHTWRDDLITILQKISPVAFERLIQRMLRESGFIQVEVTGRSGDGGIDGQGIMRLGGLLSFRVIFQCKRWQNSITPSLIRDFRGAMVGRADKGLFITTSTFTKEAMREATRDGAPAIDLIDGEQLVDKLRELALGVRIQKVEAEQVTIDKDWFQNL
jgi:restriction system protein